MEVPERPEAWTYETVVNVVTRHEFEPMRFDYKAVLNPTKGTPAWEADHAASIRRTVCSMANGDGGYILFGVQDHKVKVATPEDRIVGIPIGSDLLKQLGDKLATVERPVPLECHAISLPGDNTKCVFVVWVPTSNLRPHIDSSDGRFLIRGPGGSANPMGFIQVRDQMLYTEGRLQKVTLLRFELATLLEVNNMLYHQITRHLRFNTNAFKLLLADICDMLQSDGGLLKLLYEIGSGADILNPLLDKQEELRPSTSYEKSELATDIIKRRSQLQDNCGRAQARLEALFGPLIPGRTTLLENGRPDAASTWSVQGFRQTTTVWCNAV